MRKYYIEEAVWQKIYAGLKEIKEIRVKNENKTRVFMENVFFILKTGSQWRALSYFYTNWRGVHKRYFHWCKKGVWDELLSFFSSEYDSEYIMIDSTVIRAHACSARYSKGNQKTEALGRSKGGFTTKIHAVTDALGLLLRFVLTPGQESDFNPAPELLSGFSKSFILADKGYDSNAIINQIKSQNSIPVIPPKSNRKIQRFYDHHIYKERSLIENFFYKLKNFRRIASRFDMSKAAYTGFLNFASILLWLR